jgi:segregation and condensation protein B
MSDNAHSEDLAPDEHARNRSIIEALLIASDVPIGVGKIASVLSGVEAREIRTYVDDLNNEYLSTGRSFKVTEVAGGFQLMVHPEYASWARRLLREKAPARLSQAALETLAMIAFRQPLTKAEVEHIRGVTVDGVLRHLLEKGLIRISGRADGPGRPLLYGTTRDFLKHFGLKTLSDLPKLREVEELFQEGEERASEGGVLEDLFKAAGQGSETPDRGAGDADGAYEGESDGGDGSEGASESISGPGGCRLPEGE